jgi:hypothetical protein
MGPKIAGVRRERAEPVEESDRPDRRAAKRKRKHAVGRPGSHLTMDDERLKNPPGPGHRDYFDELLERIREIRASERRFYRRTWLLG